MKLEEFSKYGISTDVIYVLFTQYTPVQRNTSPDDFSGTIVKYWRGFDSFFAEDYFGLGNSGRSWMKGKSWHLEKIASSGYHFFKGPLTKSQLLLHAHVNGLTPLYKFSPFLRDYIDDRYLMIPHRLEDNEMFRLEKIA